MSVSLPNGGIFSIGSAYSDLKAITGITNASPAVATSTGHGFANGDIVEIRGGWAKLNNRVVVVANVTSNTFELKGIDTSDDDLYPAGGAAGATARSVDTFVQLAQITGTGGSGGEQQFATYKFLEDDEQKQIPTSKSPRVINLTIADDPTLPGYIEASKANEDRLQRVVRFRLPSGSFILYNAFVSINETPSTTDNEIMTVSATLSIQGRPTRYAS